MINVLKQLWKTVKRKATFNMQQEAHHDGEVELLRFTTAGSVDDGKSTLIGRILFDSGLIPDDQYESIKLASERKGEAEVNLAMLTDGLRAEREQCITIDVAYRYFATKKRRFIIADTPGHIQYTRNMVTGASTANLALVLVDARKGITEQTRRHIFIASLLKIPHLLLCVNKMDLVAYNKEVFDAIKSEFSLFSAKLEISDIQFIPVSALKGDNIVTKSENTPWYEGPSLLYLLENLHINSDYNLIDCRFPVQYVVKPYNSDYRAYAGMIAAGIFKPGDKIMHLPSRLTSSITSIEIANEALAGAYPPMSVCMQLKDDIDISRGDMIVRENNSPAVSNQLEVMICWFSDNPLTEKNRFILKHTTREVKAVVQEIRYKIDINTLHRIENTCQLTLNEFARISIKTSQPLFFDKYKLNRATGSLILIDEKTFETVGAGMIL